MSFIRLFYSLSESSREASLLRLNLGPAGVRLGQYGLHSIGALLKALISDRRVLERIPELSSTEIETVLSRLKGLRREMDSLGDLGLATAQAPTGVLSSALNVRQIPDARADLHNARPLAPTAEVTTGEDFIKSLPEVVDLVVKARGNDVDRMILVERLARQPHERKSLDEIAKAIPRSITRERVRQREQILLNNLSEALLLDRGRKLGLYFRDSFRGYWERAFEVFQGRERLSFQEFIDGLQVAWGVTPDKIYPHLALITSILTRKAMIPENIRRHLQRDPKLFQEFHPEVPSIAVSRFPIGRASLDLADRGIATVGELIDAVRNGTVPEESTTSGRAIGRLVDVLGVAIDEHGLLDFCRVSQLLGISVFPSGPRSSPAEFTSNLISDVQSIIESSAISKRSPQLFRLRIAVERSKRPTLDESAKALGTHSPSIKREETVLLKALNDYLIEQDASKGRVFIASDFLNYWREARDAYRRSHDNSEEFRAALCETWGKEHISDTVVEVLWAVLNEYPSGRPRQMWKKPRENAISMNQSLSSASAVVILRGFRRAH